MKDDSRREEHSVRTGRGRGSLTVPGTDSRAGKMEHLNNDNTSRHANMEGVLWWFERK